VAASEGPSPETLRALSTLLREVLADPKQRKAFFADPGQTLGKLGLPESLTSFLHDLSYEELRLLGRTSQAMQEANLVYRLDDGGTVCFL
jgi:hypothetical protein